MDRLTPLGAKGTPGGDQNDTSRRQIDIGDLLRIATPSRAFSAIGIVAFGTADRSPQAHPLVGQSIVNIGHTM